MVDGRIGFTAASALRTNGGATRRTATTGATRIQNRRPVVAEMQAVFMVNWIKTRSECRAYRTYFPGSNRRANTSRRCSTVRRRRERGHPADVPLSIAAARKRIRSAGVLRADDLTIELPWRRVSVASNPIITPGPETDKAVVRRRALTLGSDVGGGLRIYEFQPTNFHCKVMVVDGIWSSVGSTNFDNRSFR